MLYSIIINFKEDTYVIQHASDNPDSAIYDGLKSHGSDGVKIFNSKQFSELISGIENEEMLCVEINNLKGVWVHGFLVEDEYVEIHAIETYQVI